jgi:hypothetical protein
VGHPLRRLRADRLQGHAARVHALEQADSGAEQGSFHAGGDFLGTLRDLAKDGMLPVWAQWRGEGVLAALVGDDERRREIERQLPQVPLVFYEAQIDVPTGWCASRDAYVLLSGAYQQDASKATSLGWPVVERPGAHLDIVNDEAAIAEILVNLVDRP